MSAKGTADFGYEGHNGYSISIRRVGKPGMSPALGAGVFRGFKSHLSDQFGFLFVGISLSWGVAEKPRLDGKP